MTPIYVEIFINKPIDDVWDTSQDPKKHQEWDLRFSTIHYLPKERESDAQQFNYETRIGLGLQISGKGESTGSREKSGERISALKFWSDEPLSLIKSGAGYWKYIHHEGGTRFLTQYDYKVRFGVLGLLVDFFFFRPLIGWATALSFDVLRLSLEKQIRPASSFSHFFIQMLCKLTLGFVWCYQGLVPKLLFQDSGELAILSHLSIVSGFERPFLMGVGILEIVFGLLFFVLPANRFLYGINNFLMVILLIGAGASGFNVFTLPFNPVTLNAALLGLGLIGIISSKDVPSAKRCKRKAI